VGGALGETGSQRKSLIPHRHGRREGRGVKKKKGKSGGGRTTILEGEFFFVNCLRPTGLRGRKERLERPHGKKRGGAPGITHWTS